MTEESLVKPAEQQVKPDTDLLKAGGSAAVAETPEKAAKPAKPAKIEPLVYALYRVSRCHGCDRKLEKGEIVKLEQGLEEQRAFCSKCAGLEGLEILPSGNAKITRLVKKYSQKCFIVMRWSEVWKTYERQGLYVEPQAIAQARSELTAGSSGPVGSKRVAK
ncbi:hypothetical protein BH11CYA1_BH11CYA1_42690 [soil metagenome]